MKIVKNDFIIQICSDCDYENLVVDVYWKDHPLLMLNYDKGPENMEIEVYPPPEGMNSWVFPLKDYQEVVEVAKNYLLEN